MKRIIGFFTSLVLVLSSCLVIVSAHDYTNQDEIEDQDAIPMSFVEEATYCIENDSQGNEFVVLTYVNDVTFEKRGDARTYEVTSVSILVESNAERNRLIQEILDIKESKSSQRASGTFTDEKWFHSSSLCITGTVYYSLITTDKLTYGKITDVYVECSVVNRTVLDDISFVVGQYGHTPEGGLAGAYEAVRNNVANRSITSVSNDLPYVHWDHPSYANVRINATIHRGTSGQYTYSFYVPALGEVAN